MKVINLDCRLQTAQLKLVCRVNESGKNVKKSKQQSVPCHSHLTRDVFKVTRVPCPPHGKHFDGITARGSFMLHPTVTMSKSILNNWFLLDVKQKITSTAIPFSIRLILRYSTGSKICELIERVRGILRPVVSFLRHPIRGRVRQYRRHRNEK